MHATKERVESDTSTVYSISLYESTITTRDEPGFGEYKFALGLIGLPVTARYRILRCSPSVVGTTRALIQFIKIQGQRISAPYHFGQKTNRHLLVIKPFQLKLGKNGEVHPKNKPPMNKSEESQVSMARERSACRTGTDREIHKCGGRDRAHSFHLLGWAQCFVSWQNQGFGAYSKINSLRKIRWIPES